MELPRPPLKLWLALPSRGADTSYISGDSKLLDSWECLLVDKAAERLVGEFGSTTHMAWYGEQGSIHFDGRAEKRGGKRGRRTEVCGARSWFPERTDGRARGQRRAGWDSCRDTLRPGREARRAATAGRSSPGRPSDLARALSQSGSPLPCSSPSPPKPRARLLEAPSELSLPLLEPSRTCHVEKVGLVGWVDGQMNHTPLEDRAFPRLCNRTARSSVLLWKEPAAIFGEQP